MEKIDKFNLRAYAILIHENKFLVMKESYAGEKLIKFPGGGIEFGESPTQTIIRELKEELNLNIEIENHFYTQDFFLKSKFKENEQLLTFYYQIKALNINDLKILDSGIDELIWIPLDNINPELFNLPVDKIVANILKSNYSF